MHYKGEELSKSTMPCPKCENPIDLDAEIDSKHLGVLAAGMNEYGKLLSVRNALLEKHEQINLYDFWLRLDINNRRIERLEANGLNRTEHVEDVPVTCPHCSVPIGRIHVKLSLTVTDMETKQRTWLEFYDSIGELPKEIAALVAHKLGFQSWDALKRYTDNPDLPKLLEITEDFKTKVNGLDVDSSLIYDFSKQLNSLVSTLPEAIKERKRNVVQTIIDLAETEGAAHAR